MILPSTFVRQPGKRYAFSRPIHDRRAAYVIQRLPVCAVERPLWVLGASSEERWGGLKVLMLFFRPFCEIFWNSTILLPRSRELTENPVYR